MKLSEATAAVITELSQAPLFSAVGDPLPAEFEPTVIVASSWSDALRSFFSDCWDLVRLDRRNDLTTALWGNAREAYSGWNEHVTEVEKRLKPLIRPAVLSLGLEPDVCARLENDVLLDLCLACMETEFMQFRDLDFFSRLAYWYLQGRFPCGWGGEYPSGRLLVY